MLAMSDADLGFNSPAQAAKWREAEAKLSVEELPQRDIGFGVMNVPLPK